MDTEGYRWISVVTDVCFEIQGMKGPMTIQEDKED